MLGAGHGGIESILLGILTLYGFVQLFAYKDANLTTLVPLEQLELARAQVDLYWSAPWYAALLGAVERAATLCFHLSASVLVVQVFRRRNLGWLMLAIIWHAALDAVAVFASQTWSIYLTETLIVGAGLLGLGIIYWLREPLANPAREIPIEEEILVFEPESPQISAENLEDSRYV